MKILWVCPGFLHPTTKGGQIRTLETLRELHRRHEIHFAALADPLTPEGTERSSEYSTRSYAIPHSVPGRDNWAFYAQALGGFFSSMPLAVSRFQSQAMRKRIEELVKEHRFDVVVCDFLAAAVNFSNLRDVVLFEHNVESALWDRHVENAPTRLHRVLYRQQAGRMFAYERGVCRQVRQVIAVSDADVERIRALYGVESVQAVPTGVDVDYFAPPEDPPAVTADLVFMGSMDWVPNVDGMLYFVEQVWPRITAEIPECRLDIVGRRPTKSILALPQRYPGITVTGTVPDVRPYLWRSKVSIVPLRIGGGTRLKIFESMAASKPVVSTTVGAEGLPLVSGESILLADDPEMFAQSCVRLLQDASLRDSIARTGRGLVASEFSWSAAALSFEKLLAAGATV